MPDAFADEASRYAWPAAATFADGDCRARPEQLTAWPPAFLAENLDADGHTAGEARRAKHDVAGQGPTLLYGRHQTAAAGGGAAMAELALPYVVAPITDPAIERVKYENFLKALRNRAQRASVLNSRPFALTMDLTSVCQLRCPYCSTGNGTLRRQKAVMKDELYRDLLRKMGDVCFLISYFSNGEPLLHKRFGQLLATTRHQRIFSTISTNLSLDFSNSFLRDLLTSGLGIISISLDGATTQTYSRYRRGGDFDLVVRNMRRLIELKRELGLVYPLIEWRFLRFQHNEHEEQAARSMAARSAWTCSNFGPVLLPQPILVALRVCTEAVGL